MRKILSTVLALATLAASVQAQSLLDNSYFRRSVELEAAARAAFDEGDYDLAADLAGQAKENARLSDEYVAKMLLMRKASVSIDEAQSRFDWATGVRAERRFAEDYAGAKDSLEMAKASFSTEAYDDAIIHAYTVTAYLSGGTAEEALPAFFVVRELSEKHDCLWRIAGLPFVYNDPYKWPLLYKANRQSLPDPNNPDLIYPGMTLAIPPVADELREGVWVDGRKYPTFGAED